jgi:hypothetical protein
MAQHGNQMRVCAKEGFAYISVEVVFLANGNRYEVDFKTLFLSGEAIYPFKALPSPTSDFFGTQLYL